MKQLWIILVKEIRDNLRDKRSMFSALVFGPLLFPVMMIGPIYKENKHSINFERPLELQVMGAEYAPNLLRYLKTQNIDAIDVDNNYAERIRAGDLKLTLEIPSNYGEDFSAGEPASLIIHYNSNKDNSNKQLKRLKSALDSYNSRIRSLRYSARGIDARVFTPLNISERDLSRDSIQNASISLMLPFILLFSMMMGSLYLAVDTTAGERERLSLEPLLGLPIKRSILVLGKYGAILVFMLTSMIIPLIILFVLFGFIANESFAKTYDFSASTFLIAGMIHLPAALMLTSVLLFVAAFTRSAKEAQAYLGIVMIVPMLPFLILQFMDVPRHLFTMAIPMLGQYQIIEQVIIGESVSTLYYIASIAGTMGAALVLLAGSIWLYSKESILQ